MDNHQLRGLSESDINKLKVFKSQLQQAILVCSERFLYNSTKWAAEILDGLNDKVLDNNAPYTNQECNRATTAIYCTDYESTLPPLTEKEYNKYQYAKSLFSMRQYDNVEFTLSGYDAPKMVFLRLYAKYLAGEKRKEEQTQDILGTSENSLAENKALNSIYDELHNLDRRGDIDAFCLYLYGVILRQRGANEEAATALIKSIKKFEYNWSAWMELGTLVMTKKNFYDLQNVLDQEIGDSIIKDFFFARMALETHLPPDVFWNIIHPLNTMFPKSVYIKAQMATAFYDMMDYNEADDLFAQLRQENPYRIEDMDIYSNLLYIQSSRSKLSVLAQECLEIDRYRPETCCIVANYYSIRGETAESVEYFKLALKLNRSYNWAWTLLGHDYVELKNTNAAIECYRRAINVNARDYRAWYGLGQAYEVLDLVHYAIYYYKRAAELRPYDIRMWKALGSCYTAIQQESEAANCYKRATECEKEEKQLPMVQLARIFQKNGRDSVAARYYKVAFEKYIEANQDTDEAAEAGIFLAKYYLSQGKYKDAEGYARAMLNFKFPFHVQAQALVEEIRATQLSRHG